MPLTGRLWAVSATVLAPALQVMRRRRAARGREVAARLPERLGHETAERPAGRLLWLHAASVGEAVSVLPLVAALPEMTRTLFTTGTVTSAALLARRLPELGLEKRVLHRFVPLDVPAWAARFLDHWRPDAACFVESELWPNLLEACRRRSIPTILVNARMSAGSAALWARLPGLARHVLQDFSLVAAQSAADADRLCRLGARNVVAWGDLKAAAPPLPADAIELARLSSRLGDRPRWLAASTHPGDDELVLAAHRALAARHPGLLTAVVPRHPERGAALAAWLAAPRRSLDPLPPPGGLWVADTLGELGLLYRCFPTVLIGKGFGPGGGQNPWEPARLGCAVATGPKTANFADAVSTLQRLGALRVVADLDALTRWLDTMLSDPAQAAAMGKAGLDATQAASDLPDRLAARLSALMGAG